MSEIRESQIELYLVDRVKMHGGLSPKLKWIGRNNAPDRCVILNGHTIFVEVKRPGAFLTLAQEREAERIRFRGGDARFVNTYEMVDDLIRSCLART